jgi:hypothetical protein
MGMSMENPFDLPGNPPEEGLKSEGFEQRPEREPASYEKALEAAKFLRACDVDLSEDLARHEDPAVRAAHDAIDDWMFSSGVRVAGIGTVKKARDIVLAASLYLEAGYPSSQCVLDAEDLLKVALAEASQEGNQEIIQILAAAAGDIEQRFVSPGERERKMTELQQRFEAGQQLAAKGKCIDALGVLSGILTDPFFAKNEALTAALRVQVQEAETAVRADYEKEQGSRRIASVEIRSHIDKAVALRNAGQYREACKSLSEAQTRARAARLRSLFEEAGDMIDVINRLE